ncbi:Fc receptor-like protein 3 isoform X2 [Phyllobates terribilis]|uniref:Fc receptor-like protein 3 isoform X2 n=1 Tax=Phyllobates terribilis TaxID=111132 RepID=UPI003CCA934E
MAVLALITLIALIMENSGQPVRYVVTCSPNWNHIYTGDSVTLKCDIGPNKNIDNYNFYWYKNDRQIQQKKDREHEFTINKATYDDAGKYQCWIGYGDQSHPLRLYVMDKDSLNRRPNTNFSPNFRNIFVGEKMDISCEDVFTGTRSQKYEWYKDNKKMVNDQKSVIINWAKNTDSGDYRCRKWSTVSYPIRLEVYEKDRNAIILQTPPDIVEGDSLYLRCHRPTFYNDEGYTTFYKDGAVIQTTGHSLQLPNVNKSMTGAYQCEKTIKDGILLEAKETFLFVQDLFTSPKMEGPSAIKEGDAMTLTCHNRRNPLRESTELRFTFYRNGQKVIEVGSSGTYRVQSAQLVDSGNYTCEARTPLYTVMKMSDVLYISITELFKKPMLQIHSERIREGDMVTITCLYAEWLHSPSYTFYRDSQTVQKESHMSEYVILYASEKDTGNYQCSLTYRSISKNSSKQMIVVQIAVNKPNLMVSPNKVVVGDEAALQCESSKGFLPIHYLFYHNETLLRNITVIQKKAAELKLTIKSLTTGGLYYCASYNDVYTQHLHSEKVDLLVMEPVSDINITTDKEGEVFLLGEPLTFTCSVRRGTSISVSWEHNKTMVKQNSDFYQLQDNGKVLYIHSLQRYHEGTYQCNAKNELSVSRTFSVLSEIRNITVLELSAGSKTDHTIWWSMLGILLLVITIVGGLIITSRKKMYAVRICHNKTPSTGMRTERNNEDVNEQNTFTGQEVVYANIPTRKDLGYEEEGCTYITVKAVHDHGSVFQGWVCQCHISNHSRLQDARDI